MVKLRGSTSNKTGGTTLMTTKEDLMRKSEVTTNHVMLKLADGRAQSGG